MLKLEPNSPFRTESFLVEKRPLTTTELLLAEKPPVRTNTDNLFVFKKKELQKEVESAAKTLKVEPNPPFRTKPFLAEKHPLTTTDPLLAVKPARTDTDNQFFTIFTSKKKELKKHVESAAKMLKLEPNPIYQTKLFLAPLTTTDPLLAEKPPVWTDTDNLFFSKKKEFKKEVESAAKTLKVEPNPPFRTELFLADPLTTTDPILAEKPGLSFHMCFAEKKELETIAEKPRRSFAHKNKKDLEIDDYLRCRFDEYKEVERIAKKLKIESKEGEPNNWFLPFQLAETARKQALENYAKERLSNNEEYCPFTQGPVVFGCWDQK